MIMCCTVSIRAIVFARAVHQRRLRSAIARGLAVIIRELVDIRLDVAIMVTVMHELIKGRVEVALLLAVLRLLRGVPGVRRRRATPLPPPGASLPRGPGGLPPSKTGRLSSIPC
jgi:hypothetical protein